MISCKVHVIKQDAYGYGYDYITMDVAKLSLIL